MLDPALNAIPGTERLAGAQEVSAIFRNMGCADRLAVYEERTEQFSAGGARVTFETTIRRASDNPERAGRPFHRDLSGRRQRPRMAVGTRHAGRCHGAGDRARRRDPAPRHRRGRDPAHRRRPGVNIYLAGRWSRRDELAGYARRLYAAGHWVTSRWLFEDHGPDGTDDNARYAVEDREDVIQADCILSFTEDAKGWSQPRRSPCRVRHRPSRRGACCISWGREKTSSTTCPGWSCGRRSTSSATGYRRRTPT